MGSSEAHISLTSGFVFPLMSTTRCPYEALMSTWRASYGHLGASYGHLLLLMSTCLPIRRESLQVRAHAHKRDSLSGCDRQAMAVC